MFWLKLFLGLVCGGSILYSAIFILPEKLALAKKYGGNLTNDDLLTLAKEGKADVLALVKKSRKILWVGVISGVSLSLIHSFTKV